MIFILYKLCKNDTIIFNGAYECRSDAEDKQKLLTYAEEKFEIVEIPYWKHTIYNKKQIPSVYTEEDNNIDESD